MKRKVLGEGRLAPSLNWKGEERTGGGETVPTTEPEEKGSKRKVLGRKTVSSTELEEEGRGKYCRREKRLSPPLNWKRVEGRGKVHGEERLSLH